ncbi:MAG: TMEM165/GDT1 family protein [Cyanobacteria bacterium P01_A01_bin.84]
MSVNTEVTTLKPEGNSLTEVQEHISSENINQVKAYESTNDEVAVPVTPQTDSTRKPQSIWMVFASTFITIFLAEIGDKTQLSTLMMSAESHSPWVVFFGSAAALISTSLIGVLLGSQMAKRLSPRTVEKAAGLMMLFVSAMLFWDVFH